MQTKLKTLLTLAALGSICLFSACREKKTRFYPTLCVPVDVIRKKFIVSDEHAVEIFTTNKPVIVRSKGRPEYGTDWPDGWIVVIR